MRVAILGPGRLGGTLARLLPEAVVWRRGDPIPPADVWWLTVPDPAIAEVAALLPRSGIALHAAGGLPPSILGDRAERGVCHPLMTFPGAGIPPLQGAYCRIAGTPAAKDAARTLALRLGMNPRELPEGQEVRYHAAASLASGHLAAVFEVAVRTMAGTGVTESEARAMLGPLAAESLARVREQGAAAITGPAARGDLTMIARHGEEIEPDFRPMAGSIATAIPRLKR